MKAKMKPHKLLSLLLALVMVVGMLPAMGQVAYAESTLPTISNVVISSDGVLTWDAVEGAKRYSVSVANFGGYVDETSYDLKYNCNFFNTGSGTKNIHLVAEDADKNDIAEWYGSYDYVDDRPQLDAPQNIQLNGPIISWDPVPNATYYVVNIIGDSGKRHQVTDTFYVYDDLVDGNAYFFVVVAYALEYRGNGTEKTMVYHKVLYPITVTNGTAKDGYMRILTEAEQGTDVILFADAVPEGSVFRGWRLGGVEVEEPKNKVIGFTMPGNAVTATALYGIPHTVTVENGICTATGTNTGQFFEGDTVWVTAHDAPQGYQLKGWTSDDVTLPSGSISNISFTMPAKDVVIKAEYKPVSYIVKFDANGHGTAPNVQSVENGKTATKPNDLTADGWTFCGWYKDAECTEYFDFSTAITNNITLYAAWTQGNTYTVTFNANGHGTAPEPQIVKEGGKATRPATDPTAEGWIFGGWMKGPTGYTGYFDFATETITKGITLYADWKEPVYLSFDANGGAGTMEPVAVYPGHDCTLPECGFTEPQGKQFKGWGVSSDVTEVLVVPAITVNNNRTIYAIWEDKTSTENDITVTFDANGHGTAPVAQTVESGMTATKPADPTADGWTFGGWYTDAACTKSFDFSTTVTENITLYAKWTEAPKQFMCGLYNEKSPHGKVSFGKGGSTGNAVRKDFDAGTEITAYAYPDEGFVFKEWKDYFNNTVTANNPYTFTLNENVLLYAIFEEGVAETPDTCTVTFNANGHGTAPAEQTVESGKTATKPANPSEEGWTFSGWYTDAACTKFFDFNTAITGDITLYAKWRQNAEADTYWCGLYTERSPHGKVKLDAVNVTSTTVGQNFAAGTEITAYAYPDEGYLFKAWQDEAGDVVSTSNPYKFTLNSETYLYAIFEEGTAAPTEYAITVTDGKATVDADTKISKAAEGTKVTLTANAAPTDKVFDKWVVEYGSASITLANATSETTTFEMPAGEVIVKATYKDKPVTTYTVTFDSNGGSAVTAQSIEAGQKATKPADPTKDGYDFKGWTLNGSAYDFNTAVNGNITLVATWEQQQVQPTVYTVTFDSNGGSAVAAQNIEAGQKATKPADPTKDGYDFKGWTLNGSAYDFNTAVNGNITLVATWEQQQVVPTTYTVTVNGSYASTTGAGEYAVGETVNISAGSRSGYTFDGWTSSNVTITNADSRNANFVMPDDDVTVTAHWTRNAVPVTPTEPSIYTIKVEKTDNGAVTVSPKAPKKGDTVTITPKPEDGYTVEQILVTDKNGDPVKVTNNGDGTYSFTQPAGKVTVKATFMEDNSMLNFFVDVPAGAYYYDAVLWAAENGITGGVDDTHFAPNSPCTRAQIVTFLWRAAGSPEPETVSSFADVPADSYYAKAVAWAVENGITTGTGDGMFSPDATCTRAQAMAFIWRSQKSAAADGVNPFTDVAADAYYAGAVQWAVENGVTNGTSDTTFSPNTNCTRAQIVTFLFRCLGEE